MAFATYITEKEFKTMQEKYDNDQDVLIICPICGEYVELSEDNLIELNNTKSILVNCPECSENFYCEINNEWKQRFNII